MISQFTTSSSRDNFLNPGAHLPQSSARLPPALAPPLCPMCSWVGRLALAILVRHPNIKWHRRVPHNVHRRVPVPEGLFLNSRPRMSSSFIDSASSDPGTPKVDEYTACPPVFSSQQPPPQQQASSTSDDSASTSRTSPTTKHKTSPSKHANKLNIGTGRHSARHCQLC